MQLIANESSSVYCCLCSFSRNLQHFPVKYDFRSKFEYSNYPYVLAGYVTEKLRGKTWEDDVTETLFKELGRLTK